MENYRIRRIKGDIVEAICKNHFAAMGFQVENAGVEHFANQFANRSSRERGELGGTNVNKIQNYIGRLPDLLVGHEKHDHHFVEAKFRDDVTILDFAKELFWDYRKQIFGREFRSSTFKKITEEQWDEHTSSFELRKAGRHAHLDAFMHLVTQGDLDPERIQVPMMFYVVVKDAKSFSLFLIRFDEDEGKFLTHQAGKTRETASADIATQEFLSEFDKSYAEVVAPVLRDVFSADLAPIEAQPEKPKRTIDTGSILDVCLTAALKIKASNRYGVYFGQLLRDPTVIAWLKQAGVETTKRSLKIELEKCDMGQKPAAFTMADGRDIDLNIRDYGQDFYFAMP